ncbi:MAG: FAD-dependent oxidoreductase [Bacillota bacterium]
MKKADILIIGAGVIGLSIAYHLAAAGKGLKIIVFEKEKFPGMGSTAQCTGGIRHQFSSRVNIQMTVISLEHFRNFNSQMDYPIYLRQRGYLFTTARGDRLAEFHAMLSVMKEMGIPASFLTPEHLTRDYPFLHTGDLKGATYCPLDGYADPYGVIQGYLQQARKRGVEVRCNEAVTGILTSGREALGLTATGGEWQAAAIINAAGPDFNRVSSLAGLSIPALPYRRQVYVCEPMAQLPAAIPLVVDLDTGFYIHAEKNGTLLLGGTDGATSPGRDTNVDWNQLDDFIEKATARIPCLQEARLRKAYVGIRSMTPDYRGVLGPSGLKGFFLAGGFGGTGFMHAPAIGQITSQLLLEETCNIEGIASLSPERFNKTAGAETTVF